MNNRSLSLPLPQIDSHLACAPSGFIPDARTLVEYARVESQNHRFTYNEPMGVRALTQAVSDLALNFGEGDPSLKKKPMVLTTSIYTYTFLILLLT